VDKDRQFRMLIPPFFLVASVLWEAYLSGGLPRYLHSTACDGDPTSLKTVLSILGVVGVITLPLGYAISMSTIILLRLGWCLFSGRSYEAPISETGIEKIRSRVGPFKGDPRSEMYAVAVFDHVLLEPPIHQWIFRRWTTFNICTQCVTALLLSVLFGLALHIQPTFKWALTLTFAIGIFVYQAFTSWRETWGMFDFIVDREVGVNKREPI
jgi:hypothetical protein